MKVEYYKLIRLGLGSSAYYEGHKVGIPTFTSASFKSTIINYIGRD